LSKQFAEHKCHHADQSQIKTNDRIASGRAILNSQTRPRVTERRMNPRS